tara:strand:+ start:2258 stop:2440 length:183 start_codon:yes stop_codon:yes gene_type:complete
MDNFIEFEDDTKAIKSINLEDFSIEDLEEYISELNSEIKRAKLEVTNRMKSKEEATKYFK